jgi:ATPase subunit of ABC transporter with duplicated ATPase domains
MISFSRINKQYGRQVLFVDASFQLNSGEKVGLVGPNGAGKTTLFRMIVGEESADDGEVTVPRKATIGYFRQDVEEMSGRSVLDEAIAGSGRVGDLHHELEALRRYLDAHLQPGETFFDFSNQAALYFLMERPPEGSQADREVIVDVPLGSLLRGETRIDRWKHARYQAER